MNLRVVLVGCGAIGRKRAQALPPGSLIAVVDADRRRAEELARGHPGCAVVATWQEAVRRDEPDAVVVSTTNDALAVVTLAAVQHGKHVLVEKPAARSADELTPVLAAAQAAGVTVKVGFNHRFHPALHKARQIVDSGAVGPLLYVRGRYGHGGRLGYDREWRADPAVSGGGELLDQGVHLIDLARWFLGDFAQVQGTIATWFWDMPVEDNGFVMLRTAQGQLAWLHASCTEWKNLFCFEIFGRDGKLQIDGLGGSYGVERLAHYQMLPRMGPPETSIWEYPGDDQSWQLEFAHFADCIARRQAACGNLGDAQAALQIIGQVYRESGARISDFGAERRAS